MDNTRLLRSDALNLLRFPLAVVVVIVHTFSYEEIVVSGITYQPSEYSLFCDASLFVDAFVRGISVPIYFFISGYVFFIGVNFCKDIYVKKIKNRINTLLIPYIIWNAITIFFILFKSLPIFESFLSYNTSDLNISCSTILKCFWCYDDSLNPHPIRGTLDKYEPINLPLWYLRDLMVIVLTTPIINLIVKRLKKYSIFVFLSIYIVSLALHLPISRLFGGYFFFSLGAFMGIFNIDMMLVFKKYFKLSIVLYFFNSIMYLLFCSSMPEIANWLKVINAIFALLASFNIAVWILQNTSLKVSPFLASSSFFIYVSHIILIGRLRKVLFMIIKPDNGVAVLSIYVLTALLSVLFLLLTFFFLKKYFPSILKLVAGRK